MIALHVATKHELMMQIRCIFLHMIYLSLSVYYWQFDSICGAIPVGDTDNNNNNNIFFNSKLHTHSISKQTETEKS